MKRKRTTALAVASAERENVKTIIVTRHAPLVDFLREVYPHLVPEGTKIIEHVADPSVLDGAHIIGVLPLHLAARCARVTEVPLALTPEDRANMAKGDLPLARLREIAGKPVTYRVVKED